MVQFFSRRSARWGVAVLLAGALWAAAPLAQTPEQEKLNAALAAYEAKNYTGAFYLWLSLAQAGNRGAYFNIGRMYVYGTGAPQDIVEAYKWMHLAAEAGLPDGIAARARLASNMTASEIKSAMGQAEEWKRANGR